MEGLAKYRRARGLPARCIQLGPISDSGVVGRSAGLTALSSSSTVSVQLTTPEQVEIHGTIIDIHVVEDAVYFKPVELVWIIYDRDEGNSGFLIVMRWALLWITEDDFDWYEGVYSFDHNTMQ